MASTAARKTFCFLTALQIKRLHTVFLKPNSELSQPGMLDSAAQSPLNTKYYANQENVFQLAAVLSEKIMKNHAFQDGNKRTALLAANMFLKMNGYTLQEVPSKTEDADGCVSQPLADAHVAVCTNAWTAEQLGQLYQSVARELNN